MRNTFILSVSAVSAGLILIGSMTNAADVELSQPTTNSAAHGSALNAQPLGAVGPDVVVWDLQSYTNYSASGGYDAYSIGTVSCNVGDEPLLWLSNNNQHPVIGQSMYRLAPGPNGHPRMEMIGQSWLKHGFCALSQSECGPCQATSCSTLGVNCSDPYTASRNGSQSTLGPKFEVNATTGVYPYPPANPVYSGSTARRLRVPQSMVTNVPSGSTFFVEVNTSALTTTPPRAVMVTTTCPTVASTSTMGATSLALPPKPNSPFPHSTLGRSRTPP